MTILQPFCKWMRVGLRQQIIRKLFDFHATEHLQPCLGECNDNEPANASSPVRRYIGDVQRLPQLYT